MQAGLLAVVYGPTSPGGVSPQGHGPGGVSPLAALVTL